MLYSQSNPIRNYDRVSGMNLREMVAMRRDEIIKVAAQHGARNVRLFGSVVRGEADERSDVDFLVDMESGRSLLDLGGLLMDLKDVLGRDVDVVTEKGLNPRIRDRVLREAVALRGILESESGTCSRR